jgi:diguanylate cyclase (GGDEF)-like protein
MRMFRTAAIGAGIASGAVLALLLTRAGGPETPRVVSILAQLVAPLLAAAACARRARQGGPARRAWALLGASAASWGAGQAVWCWYELVARQESPFPSAADVGYLSAVPFAVAGLLAFPAAPTAVSSRLRTLFDGVIIGLSLLFVAWALVLGELWGDGGDVVALVIGLAYPLGDVLLATMVVLVLGRGIERRAGPAALLAPALLSLAVADMSFAYLTQVGTYRSGSPTDVGWVAGYLLIGLAALRPSAAPAVPRSHLDRGRVVLPYVPLVLAAVVGTAVAPLDGFLVALGIGLALLVVARQLLTLVENSALTRDLERTVTELRVREDELHHRAFHDPLTNLANRVLFRDRVGHALTLRRQGGVAVLFLDLDDFKRVNDTLGHAAGDQLLVAVAERLRASVRPGDTIARLGGDEFAVLLEDVAGVEEAERAAQRVGDALLHPFRLGGRELPVRASVGFALAQPGDEAEALLRHADLAMYAAKGGGKGGLRGFEPGMAAMVRDEFELRADLRDAVQAGQMVVHYQPLVDLASGRARGVEALVRWAHPQRGLLLPGAFMELAEETGAIVAIGRHVLHTACAQMAAWHREETGLAGAEVSVNLSPRQLSDPGLLDDVAAALRESGLPPDNVVLELTEGMLVHDDAAVVERLGALKRLGVRLAIDDFGTGYSSLGYLRRFPVDVLKIDRAFVEELGGQGDPSLVKAILQLGDNLRLTTVAEGVEREEQVVALRGLGCVTAQGWLFAPAVAAGELPGLLAALPAGVQTSIPSASSRA